MNEHDEARLKPIKDSFNRIAEDFSATRDHPWPEFGIFKHCIPDHVSLLDVGCGNGRFLQYLLDQKKTVDYTGLDFSKELIAIARKRFPQAEFVEQSMTDFDLGKCFDRVVAIASFHHVPTRRLRSRALSHMRKHLKDDGLLIISVWNLWRMKYVIPLLKGFLSSLLMLFFKDPRDIEVPFGPEKVPRWYHAFFRTELKHALLKAGFLIEDEIKSTGNFIFICRKNMLKGVQSPALEFDQSSALASYV
jgi:SAM-dependent methyltransferase